MKRKRTVKDAFLLRQRKIDTHTIICSSYGFSCNMSSCLSLNLEFGQQAWKPIKKQFLAHNLKRKNTQIGQEIQKCDCRKSKKSSDESHFEVQSLKVTHLQVRWRKCTPNSR